jgi:hypothetical protein
MSDLKLYGGLFALVLLAYLAFWVVSSKFEADAYFRVTGKSVSTWDAMWIELRVQEGAKP